MYTVTSETADFTLDTVIENELKNTIETIFNSMAKESVFDRMKIAIIRDRYFHDMTLAQLGEKYGITRDQVRAIESKFLRTLRHPHTAENLRVFH